MTTATITIDILRQDESIDQYVKVMAHAFVDYPVMVNAFDHTPGDRRAWIERLVAIVATARRQVGSPLIVARDEDRIVGAALPSFPGFTMPEGAEEAFGELMMQAGPQSMEFFGQFLGTVESMAPKPKHTYLIMLGIDPSFQGQGIGKRMIRQVEELSRCIEGCKGIALDTEDDENVTIYQRCGFELLAQDSVGGMPVYVMWKPLQ